MKAAGVFVFAALLSANSVPTTPPAGAPPPPSAADINTRLASANEDIRQYGVWLQGATRIEASARAALVSLQAEWQHLFQAPAAQRAQAAAHFRDELRVRLARLDEANAQLRALETPGVGELPLPSDLQPAQLRDQMIVINGQLREAMSGFGPISDAFVRQDVAAARSSMQRVMASLRAVFRSQILLIRAHMSALPSDDPGQDLAQFQLHYFRAYDRILAAWPTNMIARSDPTFATDVSALAQDLDQLADAGSARLEALISRAQRGVGTAHDRGLSSGVDLLHRASATLETLRPMFDAARALAATLRAGASSVRNGQVTVVMLGALAQRIQLIQADIERASAATGAAMAHSD